MRLGKMPFVKSSVQRSRALDLTAGTNILNSAEFRDLFRTFPFAGKGVAFAREVSRLLTIFS